MRQINPTLNAPQARFMALPHKYRSFVAGFGSGKTWVGCASLCSHAWEYPGINSGYFAPTYGHIRDILYPTIEETAFDWGLKVRIHETNKEVHFSSGSVYRNTVLCRSMDKPADIVGFKIGYALIDEMDLLPKAKAQVAWRKILARMRYQEPGLKNGVDIATTPEGFKFTYDQFVAQVREKPELKDLYGIVQAATYENGANLPEDYIPSLRASYPPQLIDAYLHGQFVNLASGSVYSDFDRKLNHTDETIDEYEPLHIGMDFNVQNMSAAINVIRDGKPLQLLEITNVRDTPTMARMLRDRFVNEGHSVIIYPDASGQNTSSKNASESDLSILRQHNLRIVVDGVNPSVRDRVNAFNAQILNGYGERNYKINTELCPQTTEALEQQCWDSNGEPDKSTGHDHMMDAEGYFIMKKFPIQGLGARKAYVKGGI